MNARNEYVASSSSRNRELMGTPGLSVCFRKLLNEQLCYHFSRLYAGLFLAVTTVFDVFFFGLL